MNKKLIYQFSSTKTEGDKSMLDLLGGKGANLAEMSILGINVPPGFTVTTEVCNYFIENKSFPNKFDTLSSFISIDLYILGSTYFE